MAQPKARLTATAERAHRPGRPIFHVNGGRVCEVLCKERCYGGPAKINLISILFRFDLKLGDMWDPT